jgi:hypothetical protein
MTYGIRHIDILTYRLYAAVMEQLRTTIRLRADLLKAAKRYALEHDTTFTALVEAALEEKLTARPVPFTPRTFDGGGLQPGVNLDDNAATRDLMDGLE